MELCSIISAVGALIYSLNTGRYLFLLRNIGSWPDTWGLPGGKLEQDEDQISALVREIREELGGIILDPDFIPVEIFTSNDERFKFHTFFIAVEDEFVPILNHEHQGYAWLPLVWAPRPLHPGIARTLSKTEIIDKISKAERDALKKSSNV